MPQRAAKYAMDIFDPLGKIYDEYGREIPYEEIEPDNWMHLNGLPVPENVIYSTMMEDPRKFYIAGTTWIMIKKPLLELIYDRNEFVDKLIRGITGGV